MNTIDQAVARLMMGIGIEQIHIHTWSIRIASLLGIIVISYLTTNYPADESHVGRLCLQRADADGLLSPHPAIDVVYPSAFCLGRRTGTVGYLAPCLLGLSDYRSAPLGEHFHEYPV